MAMLTDVDIRRALGKDIVIDPFADESLSPIGYDFRIGDFVFSLEHGLLYPEGEFYHLPQKSTVQILTKESLWVSERIAGTFHSRVSLVSKGLSHISTTLDPNWYGPLLITVRNNTDEEFRLNIKQSFATLIFHRVSTPTKFVQRDFKLLEQILQSQSEKMLQGKLANQTADYIARINAVISDSQAQTEFKRKVDEANRGMPEQILASIKRRGFHSILMSFIKIMLILAFIAVGGLSLYWYKINWLFNSIAYDAQVLGVQVTAEISIIAALFYLYFKKNSGD